MLSGSIMPLFNISPDTSNHPAPIVQRYQPDLGDRRLELRHRHAAVKLAVSGSSSSGIRDHQLGLFLGSLPVLSFLIIFGASMHVNYGVGIPAINPNPIIAHVQ
jgi:hypothetical protein